MSEQITTAPFVPLPGLDDDENALLKHLLDQLREKARFNRVVKSYYDLENSFRSANNGIIPVQYGSLGLILGWAQKGVDALAARCKFGGLTWSGGELDSLGYAEFAEENQFKAEVDKSTTDGLIHAVSFAVATAGGEGEPAGLLHFASAEDATGEWNPRLRRLDAFVWVNDRDDQGPTALTYFLPGKTVTATKDDGKWSTEISEHTWHVPAFPLAYRSRTKRWAGRSRISRSVRGMQRAAVRELVRLEGHMDVYSRHEFFILGADESVFGTDDANTWRTGLGKVRGIPDDLEMAEAELPTLARADVKHFQAATPEPHLAALNMYAKLVARELALPDSSIAITDFANPTSGEAYDSAQYELIAEAETVTDGYSPGIAAAARIALAIKNGHDEVPAEWLSIQPAWQDPRYQSRAALADAGAKAIASVPALAETTVGLELLGLSQEQIDRAEGELRRNRLSATTSALAAAAAPRQEEPQAPAEEA